MDGVDHHIDFEIPEKHREVSLAPIQFGRIYQVELFCENRLAQMAEQAFGTAPEKAIRIRAGGSVLNFKRHTTPNAALGLIFMPMCFV